MVNEKKEKHDNQKIKSEIKPSIMKKSEDISKENILDDFDTVPSKDFKNKTFVDHDNKKSNNNLIKKISLALSITLVLISVINIVQVMSVSANFDDVIQRSIEEQKPAQVSLTIIDPNCSNCFDINIFVDKITNSRKTNVTSKNTISLESNEAQKLIENYKIEKFPAIIVEGNLNKSGALINTLNGIGENIDEKTYVLTPTIPLYTNKDGEIQGKVSVIGIDNSDCENCDSSQFYIDQIKTTGVKISNIETYDINSKQGKDLIEKYNLDKAPSVVFSKELGIYPQFKSTWEQFGTIENDGSYILRNLKLPYFNITSNKLVGALNFTYVYDSSCSDCFDAKDTFDKIFAQFGIVATTQNIIDISKDSSLIKEYNIDKVPSLIISGDTNEYPLLDNWAEVGTVEDDGSYIFRNVDLLQLKYKDLN